MKLKLYQDEIDLYEFWQPSDDKPEPIDWIILELLKDESLTPYMVRIPVPKESEKEKRAWLKTMLTLRPAGSKNEPLVRKIDALLASENRHKVLTNTRSIPQMPIQEGLDTRLSVWQGDITTLKADAIVNAANSQMLGCFQPFHACIDNAIHSTAGPRLRDDCHRIMTLQGREESTSEAKITRGYNLPSRFVIHTVGPIIPRGSNLSNADEEALAQCYRACLSLAAETKQIKTLAFCGISTGVFGFPKKEATSIAVRTVIEWLKANPSQIDQVIFNTFDLESTNFYQRELEKWA